MLIYARNSSCMGDLDCQIKIFSSGINSVRGWAGVCSGCFRALLAALLKQMQKVGKGHTKVTAGFVFTQI